MSIRSKILHALAGSVALGICAIMLITSQKPHLAACVVDNGSATDGANICFGAVVTNQGSSALILDGIRYEWRDQTGQIHGAFAFSDWNHEFPPGAVERTTFLIPRDAQSVRVWVMYDPLLWRRITSAFLNLASKPLAKPLIARFPRLGLWLLKMDVDRSSHRLPSPWITTRQPQQPSPRSLPCTVHPETRHSLK